MDGDSLLLQKQHIQVKGYRVSVLSALVSSSLGFFTTLSTIVTMAKPTCLNKIAATEKSKL